MPRQESPRLQEAIGGSVGACDLIFDVHLVVADTAEVDLSASTVWDGGCAWIAWVWRNLRLQPDHLVPIVEANEDAVVVHGAHGANIFPRNRPAHHRG